MADFSTMKGPELEEILIKRGFKQVRKMGKAQKLELVMSGATPTSTVSASLDPPTTPTNLGSTPVPELIKIIQRKAPDMKGYTKKPKKELIAIIEGLGDTKPKPKPKPKKPKYTIRGGPISPTREEAESPGEMYERLLAKQEKEEKEKLEREKERARKNTEIDLSYFGKKYIPKIKNLYIPPDSPTFPLFEKKNKKELLEEARKLGLKGMGPKKKEEVLSAVVNEIDRRSSAAEEPPKAEPEKAEEEYDTADEGSQYESADEEYEHEWQKIVPFPKPSLQTYEKISGHTIEESFDRILIIMEVLFFLKRSKKMFIMDWGEGKKEVNTKGVYNMLDNYYNEFRILFGKATKFWKITQPEKNKMRAKAEKLTDTDKQKYDVIKDFLEPEMGLEFEEFGDDEYFLQIPNEKEQEEEGYYDKETGTYADAAGYVGTFLLMFLDDNDSLEAYVKEVKRQEELEEEKEEEDDEALRARDIVQPLELEEGQDWKTLSLPKKVRYFLSMVEYEPSSMGQIERQSLAKINRMIERARYDSGEDEEMPEHYFPSWNSEKNLEFGENIFEEFNWRRADQVPEDTENVPREPGRFFKGVFIEDDEEYIVNYFGMYGVKDVIEDEIKSKGLNEWRRLSWVKYKRFNFWQRPIVLEMTKGPMMIVPPYNIYDIRQSTSGVRPIQGVFEFSGQGGFRRMEPDDFESIQDELVASYTERLEESEEEDETDEETDEEEERVRLPPKQWDLVKDFMFDLPSNFAYTILGDDTVSIDKLGDIYHYILQFQHLEEAVKKNFDSDRFKGRMMPVSTDGRVHRVNFRERVKEVKDDLNRLLKRINEKFMFLHNDEFIEGPVKEASENIKRRSETGAIFRDVEGYGGLGEEEEVGYWFEPPEWFEKWGFIVKYAEEKLGEDTGAIYTPVDYIMGPKPSNKQIKKEEEYWDQHLKDREEQDKQRAIDIVARRVERPPRQRLPPNEPEMLPDATPPVKKEKVVEVDITPPNIYNRLGVLLPAGILPPDEDARVMPMASIHAGEAPPSTVGELIKVALGEGDWSIDRPDFVTVEDEDQGLPNESGIVWLFAEILNRNDPTETNFIAACEDDYESQITIDKRDRFTEVADEVFDINTGDSIGIVDRPDDDDDEMKFIEFTPVADIKKPKPDPPFQILKHLNPGSDDAKEIPEEILKRFTYEGERYFRDKQDVVYMRDEDGEYEAIGVRNDDKSIHFY